MYNKFKKTATNTTAERRSTNRGCQSRTFCQSTKPNSTITSCKDCEKDKCNDATGVSASITMMVASVAAGVLVLSRF